MDKRIYIRTAQFEFDGIMPEEKIEELMRDLLTSQKYLELVQGEFEDDKTFLHRDVDTHRMHKKMNGPISIQIWDTSLPRARENNKGVFVLKEGFTVPTNNTMYDCVDCEEVGRVHHIEEGRPEKLSLSPTGWYRICTGCGKYDGPWCNYGDD